MPRMTTFSDEILLNDRHIIADLAVFSRDGTFRRRLPGVPLAQTGTDLRREDTGAGVASTHRHGFVWACLGTPARDLSHIPESSDPDRLVVAGGSVGVRVPGLPAAKNFPDMGHFPVVPTGWPGKEPHTKVLPYRVGINAQDDIVASDRRFRQPLATPTASFGVVVDYICGMLRRCILALFRGAGAGSARLGSISHVAQRPAEQSRLAETPVRADAVLVACRRWLCQHNVTFRAIPARA